MNQVEKNALKAKAVEMVGEMLVEKGFEVNEIVEGLVVEMEGEFVVFKAVVKKAEFDLADALQEKADKDKARVEREADRLAKKAEKEAKKAEKAKAE